MWQNENGSSHTLFNFRFKYIQYANKPAGLIICTMTSTILYQTTQLDGRLGEFRMQYNYFIIISLFNAVTSEYILVYFDSLTVRQYKVTKFPEAITYPAGVDGPVSRVQWVIA